MGKYLAVVSGGMDSVTMAYDLKASGELGGVVSFDYGQRHRKELVFAEENATLLKVAFERVPLDGIMGKLRGSALTDPSVPVPHGHYAEENMRATVVPNRNAIMLSIAVGLAVAYEYDGVATAVHAGDHFIYPDCRPEFIQQFGAAMVLANDGFAKPRFNVRAPYLYLTKAQIVGRGAQHDVPFNLTWSCYEGGENHCGACGTCFERREAFALAGVIDPTVYDAMPQYEAPGLEG